jgi:hypothetical protein
MALGTHLWRSATWLGVATPAFTASAPITEVVVGLDRLYLRASQGVLVAIDSRTGASMGLGPLPSSPRVVSIAALDAWRAVTLADLRGVLVTVDAGSSWRAVRLPIEATRAIAVTEPTDAFVVGGLDGAHTLQWWQVLPDGQASWLSSSTSPPVSSATSGPGVLSSNADASPLGAHPLQAAIEDGWPLSDGTALVARDGALVLVRLADGAVLETAAHAFALDPARCHAVSLARLASFAGPADRGAFGFVCGEAHGRTAVYRWDAAASRLVELRRFDAPREVLAAGNGGLAVRGPCDARAVDVSDEAFCVMTPDGDWREVHVSPASRAGAATAAGASAMGAMSAKDAASPRVVVLSSGQVAIVHPPDAGDLSTARLTITHRAGDSSPATEVALRIQPTAPETARALRYGLWMDGFEERRPGVLGGWIDAAGSVLGVEIALDGEVRAGEYIRDAGSPIVSGRWAFGWTPSGGGFETTDGGMIWTKEIALPAPLVEPRAGRDRSCGPVGCVLAGWLRVGWGVVDGPHAPDPPPPRPRGGHRPPNLVLACAPVGPGLGSEGLAGVRAPGSAAPARGPPLGAPRTRPSTPASGAVASFRPFAGRAAPAMSAGDVGLSFDASHVLDRGPRSRALARAYVWGPGGSDPDPSARWQVLWSPPWHFASGPGPDTRSSAVAPAPWASLDVAARALGNAVGLPPEWSVVPGDDGDHALLVERRVTLGGGSGSGSVLLLATLESDRAPLEVRRPAGEPWTDLQGAVRSGGRWYVATSQSSGETAATIVWLLDGAVAREVGRLPRLVPEFGGPLRLVRRTGANASGAIGLIATGADIDGSERGSSLWVVPFDPETRAFEDPEPLAPVDLSDRTVGLCTGDDGGWELETAFPGSIDLAVGTSWRTRVQGALARLRVSRTTACIDDVFGAADAEAAHAEGELWATSLSVDPTGRASSATRSIPVTVITDHTRARLRCRAAAR